jgi:hypothetical protein
VQDKAQTARDSRERNRLLRVSEQLNAWADEVEEQAASPHQPKRRTGRAPFRRSFIKMNGNAVVAASGLAVLALVIALLTHMFVSLESGPFVSDQANPTNRSEALSKILYNRQQ